MFHRTVCVAICIAFAVGRPAAAQDDAVEGLEVPALRSIAIEVTIVDAPTSKLSGEDDAQKLLKKIEQLESEGALSALSRIRMSTVESQPAMVQYGENVMVVDGVNRAGPRAPVSMRRENTGTLLKISARIVDGRIVADFTFEQSRLVPVAKPMGEEEDAVAPTPATENITTQSTVSVPDGGAVIVGSRQSTSAEGRSRKSLVLLSARIEN